MQSSALYFARCMSHVPDRHAWQQACLTEGTAADAESAIAYAGPVRERERHVTVQPG